MRRKVSIRQRLHHVRVRSEGRGCSPSVCVCVSDLKKVHIEVKQTPPLPPPAKEASEEEEEEEESEEKEDEEKEKGGGKDSEEEEEEEEDSSDSSEEEDVRTKEELLYDRAKKRIEVRCRRRRVTLPRAALD